MNLKIKRNLARVGIAAVGLSAIPAVQTLAMSDGYSDTTDATSGAAAAGILGVFGAFFFFIIAIAIATFVFWVFMLVDALNRTNWPDESQRTTWIVVLVASFLFGFGWVGALVYFFMVKKALGNSKAKKSVAKKK